MIISSDINNEDINKNNNSKRLLFTTLLKIQLKSLDIFFQSYFIIYLDGLYFQRNKFTLNYLKDEKMKNI